MSTDDTAVASDATPTPMTTPATPPDLPSSSTGETTDDDAVASVAALADDLAYTLTAGQALERFALAQRKVPSLRTIQRYCIERRLAAQKIRTTYGSEWLINEEALAKMIEDEPMIAVASDANAVPVATPATPTTTNQPNSTTATFANDDAGDAGYQELATPVGERRRLADVLIENARLVATVEGRDAVIAELKEDKSFLREELREARQTRDDVKNIAERMLDTLKTMAIGRLAGPGQPPGPVEAEIIRRQDGQG